MNIEFFLPKKIYIFSFQQNLPIFLVAFSILFYTYWRSDVRIIFCFCFVFQVGYPVSRISGKWNRISDRIPDIKKGWISGTNLILCTTAPFSQKSEISPCYPFYPLFNYHISLTPLQKNAFIFLPPPPNRELMENFDPCCEGRQKGLPKIFYTFAQTMIIFRLN